MRDRFGLSHAETEDVGPRGCRVVTPRAPAVGALVQLTLASEDLDVPLAVTGQVVWVQPGPGARAGISFAGPANETVGPADWFRSLRAAREARARGEGSPRPGAGAEVRIAPPAPLDESPDAVARRLVLRARQLARAGEVRTAEVILRRALAFSPGDPEIEALLAEVAGGRS